MKMYKNINPIRVMRVKRIGIYEFVFPSKSIFGLVPLVRKV